MRFLKPTRKKAGMLVLLFALYFVARYRAVNRFDPAPLAADQLRLLTWNVGYFALAANKNLRDVDLDFVTETIRETGAQVVVLQEVSRREQGDIIAEGLGADWQAFYVETGHQNQVVCLLTNLNSIEEFVHEAGGRQMIGLSLKHPGRKNLFIAGVHSPHPARGKLDTVESIRGALAFTANRPEEIRIFAGDLNYIFDEKGEGTLYQDLKELMEDSTVELGDTYYLGSRIDHVFHAPKNLDVSLEGSGMIDFPVRLAKVPGFRDHRPIVVTYNLSSI